MSISYSFVWRKQIVEDVNLSSTTKLVAMVLHFHMDNKTGECFPSEELISKEASLTSRSVATHIKILKESRYITIQKKRGGQGWNRNCYKGLLKNKTAIDESISKDNELKAQGDEYNSQNTMNEIHSNSSYNSSINSSNNSSPNNFVYLIQFWNLYPEKFKKEFELVQKLWIKNNCEEIGNLICNAMNIWIDNRWFDYFMQLPPSDFIKERRWEVDSSPMSGWLRHG